MDVKKIDELAKLMQRYGLSRVRLEEGDGSDVELERPTAETPAEQVPVEGAVVSSQAAPVQLSAAAVAAASAAGDAGLAGDAAGTEGVTEVLAPMVGVFYVAPSPGAKPFVQLGSTVRKGETLCIIEAMKLMNEVRAEQDGEIVEVCAEDGELVEFGACIMKIR